MTSEEFIRLHKRRTRNAAIAIGLSVVVILLFFIYALIQKSEAERQAKSNEVLRMELVQLEKKTAEQRKVLEDAVRTQQQLEEELSKNKNKSQ
jgi:choline-glycine betaine transporter